MSLISVTTWSGRKRHYATTTALRTLCGARVDITTLTPVAGLPLCQRCKDESREADDA